MSCAKFARSSEQAEWRKKNIGTIVAGGGGEAGARPHPHPDYAVAALGILSHSPQVLLQIVGDDDGLAFQKDTVHPVSQAPYRVIGSCSGCSGDCSCH